MNRNVCKACSSRQANLRRQQSAPQPSQHKETEWIPLTITLDRRSFLIAGSLTALASARAFGANNTIRKVTPKGTVITVAGLPGYAGNIDGSADAARFSNPEGLALDAAGNVYVADTGNNAIRKLTPEGLVSTLVPLATATNAIAGMANWEIPLKSPDGVTVDKAGNIYIVDTDNQCIRKLAVRSSP